MQATEQFLEPPQKGKLYRVKVKELFQEVDCRSDSYRHENPWPVSMSGKLYNLLPEEVVMVASEVSVLDTVIPGCNIDTCWVFDLIYKDRIHKVWFTPVKWHIIFEQYGQ